MPGNIGPGMKPGLALALDLAVGEPAEAVHPVCLMGKVVEQAERAADRAGLNPGWRRLAGILIAVALPAGTYLAARGILRIAPRRLAGVAEAAMLASAITVRSLGEAARDVEEGLGDSLETGRLQVARIVGRDTGRLDEAGVARAAVESVAENTNDGIVAPMFYGFIGGAPLALSYRMVNTMDSMIGYKNDRYRDFGWAAARLDDLAGYAPARLTALATVVASPLARADARRALQVWLSDGAGHESPNAGVCEAAFAGALGVGLGGARCYGGRRVDARPMGTGRPPGRADIGRAVSLMYGVALVILAAGTALRWLAGLGGRRRVSSTGGGP
ncbi:MAG: cobalamin biosynthesis protein CobD [Thermoleophilia bacterium]|nr:cobalamin biosynthesis protein CobD [Thermoleophilia bacterium]